MREHLTKRAVQGLMLLSLTAATSCVDNDYDLSKDIDMTVTVGGSNLVLPGSSTEDITLEDIFDLEEGSALKALTAEELTAYPGLKEGDYVLHKGSENETETLVGVEEVRVPMEAYKEGLSDPMKFTVIPGVDASVAIPVENMKAGISLVDDQVTPNVRTLNWADVQLDLRMALDLEGTNTARRMTLKNGFELIFPDYITVASVNNNNVTVRDGHILHFNADYTVERGNNRPLQLKVSRVEFSEEMTRNGQGLYRPGHFRLDMDVTARGEAFVKTSDFPTGAREVELRLKGTVQAPGYLELKRMNGTVDPDINITLEPIQITGIPDFLKHEDTRLDLSNPKVSLIVTNHTPLAVNLNAVIQTFDEDGALLKELALGDRPEKPGLKPTAPVVLQANARQVITFARKKTAANEIEVPDMNDLIAHIPNRIQLTDIRSKAVQEDVTIEVGANRYSVRTGNEVLAPLSFGEDMNFVYEDVMDSWNEDIKDYEISTLEVELDATNKIPLELIMKFDESKGEKPSVYAVDTEGERIEDIKVKVDEQYGVMKAGSLEKPQNSTVKLTLTAPRGSMKRLDGLKYRLRAVASDQYRDIQMNKHQTLTFNRILLRIKDGIKLDLN